MSEAPERIFVTSNLIAYEEEFRPLRSTEYVRADRIEELEAKLEKVTDVALRLYYGGGVVTGDMHATLVDLAWEQYHGNDG